MEKQHEKPYKRYLELVDKLSKKEATLKVMQEFDLKGEWKNHYKRYERARGGIKDNRFCVSDEERELIMGIREHAKQHNIGIPHIKHLWTKSKGASLFVKNPAFEGQEDGVTVKDIEKAVKKLDFSPTFPKLRIKKHQKDNIMIVDPADVHVGKLATIFETGEEYNCKIAVERVKDGVSGILNKTMGFPLEKIILVTGNDILHVDSPRSTTTAGTYQDSSEMWYDSFNKAVACFVDVIKMLMARADVHVIYNPSNHDYVNGFHFAQVLKAYFANSENITFDVSIAHRKYFHYGVNLIGTTHGDGAKVQDLPDLMKTEARKAWAKSKYGYWYCHHIHHKDKRKSQGKSMIQVEKDYMDVTVFGDKTKGDGKDYVNVEYLRSPSGTDSWHHRNGYQHSPKCIEAFIHNYFEGQTDRLTKHF